MLVTGVTGGVLVVFVFVVGDMVMLVTSVTDGVMVVFVFVFGDMPMLVTGVTCGVLVVFVFVVGDMVMLVTGITDGVMVVFVFVVGDVRMRVTDVTDGVMVVFVFVVGDFILAIVPAFKSSTTMGKKKGTAGSSASTGAAKIGLDWCASTISNREVNRLRTLGFISSVESDVRHPGSSSCPKPPKGFTVMFVAFLFRGISIPAHEFLCSLLFFYGIQLWQLTPNSILHLSIFITLKEVNYFDYPMKESVQGWQQKWFYLQDIPASGRRSNLPPFEDVSLATPKKSWRNTLTAAESAIADQLYEKVMDLKNAEGRTMCGTEVVSVFLRRRVQPLIARPHQLGMYTGTNDKSRVSLADLSDEELRDEVRRMTRLSQKDNIVLTSARPPLDLKHLPAKVIFLAFASKVISISASELDNFSICRQASTVAQCYPPTPESGVEPEDDDDSEETENEQHALEANDVQGDEAPEDDARTKAIRSRKINEDLMTTAESSPSGQDDDANVTASPPPVAKSSTGLFAAEDDLEFSDDDDEVPLAKRAKLFSERIESAKESNPSTAELSPPPRTVVAKVPLSKVNPSAGASTPSTARDHPIFATVDVVADFADQFTRLESENVQLRKANKTSADQVLEANRLTTEA
ncbi:hypothetical protein QYE76_061417 [Lolium multiflorum]|uniref:Transposase (putative) gypsy type domain-containing protein n=1 Tax=Lolium multiflorum TaxID=4521 RepID=A0AAD8S175_LOLMU|nr:hypothetical protein QYE76_061417 [Lolium multiflorum]